MRNLLIRIAKIIAPIKVEIYEIDLLKAPEIYEIELSLNGDYKRNAIKDVMRVNTLTTESK